METAKDKTGRCITLSVRVDAAEKARLDETAREASLRTATFLRTCGLKRKIVAPLEKSTRNAIKTFSSNLNQLAYAYQATKNTPALQVLEALKNEAKQIVKLISAEADKDKGRN